MKKIMRLSSFTNVHCCFLLFIFACTGVVQGQQIQTNKILTTSQLIGLDRKKVYDFEEDDPDARYGGILFNVRWSPLLTEGGLVRMAYVDESPSRDTFISEKTVDASTYDLGFDVGLEGGRKKGRHTELLFGGMSSGPLRRFYAQFGMGHNFPLSKSKKFLVRPVLNLSYGNVRYELGDMTQNATYIQVNDAQFYSEKVGVSVRSNPLVLLPRIDMVVAIGKYLMLRAQGGYHFTASQGSIKVRFDGEDQQEEILVEREDITASNVRLTVNQQSIQRIPVALDGLFFSFGITYVTTGK